MGGWKDSSGLPARRAEAGVSAHRAASGASRLSDRIARLEELLKANRFQLVRDAKRPSFYRAIWKRQTWNANRAVAVIELPALPADIPALVDRVRKDVSKACGYFPFLYGIGIQLVLVITEGEPTVVDLTPYLDRLDNQWSIIQSIFLVHAKSGLMNEARTWGQFYTGKVQTGIAQTLR